MPCLLRGHGHAGKPKRRGLGRALSDGAVAHARNARLYTCLRTCLANCCFQVLACRGVPWRHLQLYLGIADGMPIAWRGGYFEYQHAHARTMGMPSAMPR